MILQRSLQMSLIAALCLVMAGCFSFGPLKYQQVRILKKEGFVQTQEGWTLGLPERLLFGFNDANVKDQNKPELARLAKQLQKYDLLKLKVIGHTDNIGAREYNQELSKKRAESVASVFVENGFERNNLIILGRGPDQPLMPNNSDDNRASNRRVALVIIP